MSVQEIMESMEYGPAPESDARAREWLAAHEDGFGLFIGGEWVRSDGDARLEVRDPATGAVLAHIAQASAADVDKAVNAAAEAQKTWERIGPSARARHLYALARQVQRHARLLAVVETLDNGKPVRETRDIDIPLVARHFYHHAGWASLREQSLPGWRPHGVAGQIVPWNFPLLMLAWKVAPALAAGNTVVLKPAEYTPLTALLFAELCQRAGLPDGAVNIVTGDGAVGEMIVRHPGIDKIAFTGSTEVGRRIREITAGTGKHLTLELGGKSPFIVFEDADLDSAVEGVVDAIWFNQGQVCCAGSRLLVQEGIADDFLARLKRRMNSLRIGAPLDKCIDMGAVVDPVQLERIRSMVARGVAEGAELYQPDIPCPEGGCFYPPTLLAGVEPAAHVAQEEIFGPVIVSMSFRTPAEAVALANNSRYGLAASLWTDNINLALDMAPKLACGVVWVNATNLFDAACGFGGYRESGFGREGGIEGMMEQLRPPQDQPGGPLYTAADFRPRPVENRPSAAAAQIDRTAKNYIGGRQKRPDSGYSRPLADRRGRYLADIGIGNRKDIRDAVEAAAKATAWTGMSGHARAQILYYLAENMAARAGDLREVLVAMGAATAKAASREVDCALARLFLYAGWADKFDGAVHNPPSRHIALALKEPFGVMGIVAPPDRPLLALISLLAPALAMGNRVVAVPSAPYPLAAVELYHLLEASDVPAGALNIVTGDTEELAEVLALHDNVDAIWYHGSAEGSAMVERASAGNLKRCWVNYGRRRDWFDPHQGEGEIFLHRAVQVKNVWVPYGE